MTSKSLAELPPGLLKWLSHPSFIGVVPRVVLERAGAQSANDDILRRLVPRATALARPAVSGYAAGAVVLGASGSIYFGANLEVAGGILADSLGQR
jgi:cytidine deaminase